MKIVKKIESKFDSTLKYIFNTDDNLIFEFSYNKNDIQEDYDIIYVPNQTNTDKNRNLIYYEIMFGINYILDDQWYCCGKKYFWLKQILENQK